MNKNSFSVWKDNLAKRPNYKWLVLSIIQFAIFFVGISSTIVNLALPVISEDLHTSIALSKWVIIIYSSIVAAFLPIAGKLPLFLGCKKVFIGGFICFTMASIGCAISPSIQALILMQIPLGIGSSLLLANANAITFFVFPEQERTLAMSINGLVASIGYAIGLIVGGFLIDAYGWTSIYWFNVPISIIAIFLSGIVFLESAIFPVVSIKSRFDFLGSLLFIVLIGSCMILIGKGMFSLPFLFAEMGLCVCFFLREKFFSFPLIALENFRSQIVNKGLVTRTIIQMVSGSFLFLIPFTLHTGYHLSSQTIGWLMTPFAIALLIAGPLGGKLAKKMSARTLTSIGFVCCILSLILWFTHEKGQLTSSFLIIGLSLFSLGAAIGFFVPSNNSHVLKNVPAAHVSTMSGLLWSAAYVGLAIGPAIAGILFHKEVRESGITMEAALFATKASLIEILLPLALFGLIWCLFDFSSFIKPQKK